MELYYHDFVTRLLNPNDYVTTKYAQIDGGFAKTTWTTVWQSDFGSPEFRFAFKVRSASIEEECENELHVSQDSETQYYAVIVGENAYPSSWTPYGFPALDFPIKGAQDFYNTVNFPCVTHKVLLENASKSEIKDAIDDYRNMMDEGDMFVFYYAGHGSSGHCLVPVGDTITPSSSQWIKRSELYDWLTDLPTSRIAVVLISCFSGGVGAYLVKDPAAFNDFEVLTACSGERALFQNEAIAFGDHLIEGLEGAATDYSNNVNIGSLYRYIKNKLNEDGHSFGPVWGDGYFSGDITLAYRQGEPQEGDYLSLNGYDWDDPNTDGDGVMEAGEKVRLKVQLCSTGNIQNVDGVLRTSDSGVNITDSTVYYQSFSAGEMQWSVGWFDMNLNFELPEGQTRTSYFTLHLTYEEDGLDYYQDVSFDKEFFWPGEHVWFEISDCPIDDSTSICHRNNGDSILQSSEEIHIRPLLCNKGTANASGIDVSVVYNGDVLDVRSYPDLAPGDCGYPKNNRYFRFCSTDYSFTGTVNLDVHIICDESSTPKVFKNAIQLHVQPVPVLSVEPEKYGFSVTRSGKSVTTDIMHVHNAGSGVMTVSDVQTSHYDTVVPEADKSFTLAPGTERNISITIHTDNIPNGTMISREVRVISDGRIADMTPPSDRIIITGLIDDGIPIFQVPGVMQTDGKYPDISGSWIVWEDRRNGNADIYAYDISTGTEQQITKDAGDQVSPRISGNLIAWEDYRNWDGTGVDRADIYGYDLSTNKEFMISADSAHEYLIGLDRNNVAFIRHEFLFDFYGGIAQRKGYNLYCYDTTTGDTHHVTAHSAEPGSPVHSVNLQGDFADGVIVWLDEQYNWDSAHSTWNSGYLPTIMKYEIDVDSAPVFIDEPLGFQQDLEQGLATSGGRIVWTESDNKPRQVWIWDNGDDRQVTYEEIDHGENSLAVGRDFIVYDKHSASGLFYWDLNENREFLLTEQLSRSKATRMDMNRVVWHSWVDSECRIYYAFLDGTVNFPPGVQAIGDTVAYEDRLFVLQVYATDPDEDVLSYSDDTPLFAIDSATGMIRFTPTKADTGVYPITITVSDGQHSVSTSFTLRAYEVPELSGDFNGDGRVWTEDFVLFVAQFGRAQGDKGFSPTYDPDGDGKVWTNDFTIFVAQFGKVSAEAKSVLEIDRGKNIETSASINIIRRDSDVLVDVSANGLTEVAAYGLKVYFDPKAFQFLGATEGDLLKGKSLFVAIPNKEGEVWVLNGLIRSVSTEADGLLSRLHFRALSHSAGGSAIRIEAIDLFDGDLHLNSIAAQGLKVIVAPKSFALYQNYPNPANPSTVISYALAEECKVNLTVYNILGQTVRTLVDNAQQANIYKIVWHGRDDLGREAASGIYLYRLEAGYWSDTKKMLLLR